MIQKKKTKSGKVIKISNANTIAVLVESVGKHPFYKKVISQAKRFLVHCQDSTKFQVGDAVSIIESRPYSKLKHWRVKG